MPQLIRPPNSEDKLAFLRMLFLRTERRLIDEINRNRARGYVDYAEVAALKRTRQTLQEMVDESFSYVPTMIETIFYRSEAAANGYANAAGLTAMQLGVVEQLSNNLLGDIMEASVTAQKHIEAAFLVGRQEKGTLRNHGLRAVAEQKAAGYGPAKAAAGMSRELRGEGVTAFVDKVGRKWSLQDYCNMAARTTARQAAVSAILTADPEHDLYRIVKIGSTCPVCAPLEGRVYSRSGTNPEYPALSNAFGKVDPEGPNDLSNTYLNIHPNCLHSLVKYTTMGRTEQQIQKDKDFSSFEKNPVTADPRTKKQIAAYEEKVKNRQRLLRDYKQHKRYIATIGNGIPKTFETFRRHKAENSEKFQFWKIDSRRRNALANHPELQLPDAERAVANDSKFTSYLFGGGNADGLAKGRAFNSRLGYNERNWKDLQQEILDRAGQYPVKAKENRGHGVRYEQEIILYGRKNKPANVLVGWIKDGNTGEVRMTTAYITEVAK